MVEEEAARFIVLRNMVNFNNNLGGALALISRRDVRQGYEPKTSFQRCTIFYQVADLFIFTEAIGRDPDKHGPVDVWRYDGMEPNMVCISGDKGDAAQLLGLPMILFDDREDNLVDVVNKGSKYNVGVVVRRGDAQFKLVHRRNEHLVINNPHDWVYWSWRFWGVRHIDTPKTGATASPTAV